MTKIQKKHNSCVRVLEFLKLLTQEDINLNNIYENNEEKFNNIEAPETFLKYINTLYISGLMVKKVGKKYSLCNSISTINFSEEEFELLLRVYENFNNCCLDCEREELELFFTNVFKFLPLDEKNLFLKKITKIKTTNHQNSLTKKAQEYQNFIDSKQKLKITYNDDIIDVEPKSVEIENQHIYLNVYCTQNANIMKLLTDNIKNIKILPTRTKSLSVTETVVFEVYNRLSYNYRLRECEHVQAFFENKKVIVNCGEDRKLLLKRLLKYGENCKVLLPKTFRYEYLNSLSAIANKLKGAL